MEKLTSKINDLFEDVCCDELVDDGLKGPIWEMGEKPSPSGDDFTRLAAP